MPPLGLLTVAAMLPKEWEKRLIDMNVTKLSDSDLEWADYIFVSAMVIQRQGVREIIERCRKVGKKIVAGGPLFTLEPENFPEINHLVLNEAEITLPQFLADLEKGNPKHLYTSNERPDLNQTPLPAWELIDKKRYSTMPIQFSRGCPYDCEFCDIVTLFGRTPRIKSKEKIIAELSSLYHAGWKGGVALADDNLIAHKSRLKKEILPAITEWMRQHKYPFSFSAEVSINLADDEELMAMLIRAGFDLLFVGIETPNEKSLAECNKIPNQRRDLLAAVKKMQRAGFVVDGGFILGFDNDDESIFFRLVRFIQKSGIVTAMVGLLNAPRGSKLYERLFREGRLLTEKEILGDNTAFATNLIPKMKTELLLKGYKNVLEGIYSVKAYYSRIREFFQNYNPPKRKPTGFHLHYLLALFKSFLTLGVLRPERYHFWQLILWALFRKPRLFPLALRFAIYRVHFSEIAQIP